MSRKRKLDGGAILDAAIQMAEEHGYREVTREQIATQAGVATGSVNLYFGTMHALRKRILRHALAWDNKKILAQAIVANDQYIGSKLNRQQRQEILVTAA